MAAYRWVYDSRHLTAKNRYQRRNPTLGNRVWATFTFFTPPHIFDDPPLLSQSQRKKEEVQFNVFQSYDNSLKSIIIFFSTAIKIHSAAATSTHIRGH